MRRSFLLSFLTVICLAESALAQGTETTVERPAASVTTAASAPAITPNDFALKEGEIRLTGKVTGVNFSRSAVSIFADSFAVPNGNSKVIDPPRPKSITLTESALVLNAPDALAQRFPLSALKRGDDVAVIGREAGQSFAARLIYYRVPLPGLLQERAKAGFKTKRIENAYQSSDAPAVAEGFEIVRYPAPVGELAAYLTPDSGDGKKRPAVLWAHGGFAGIGPATAEQAKPFIEAGCVVMCPSWRGENGNPGQYELFGGEVEDAVAALHYLSQLPYVDASRIYMAGHSTGGTMTLLAAASTPLLRAAFSLGGAPDIANVLRNGGYEHTPFDKANDAEVRFRSPINWVSFIRAPLWYFEGEKSFYVTDAKWMEATAQRQGVTLQTFIIERNDHYTIVNPLIKAIAQKIQNDTGPVPNISFSADEIKAVFPPEAPIGVTK